MAITVSYMTESQLKDTLSTSGHIDTSVQNAIIQQLISDGDFPSQSSTVEVEQSTAGTDSLVSAAQVFDTKAANVTVNTDAALQAVVSDSSFDVNLTVSGSYDVVVGLSNGDDTVVLTGSGSDTVWAGDGTSTISDHGSGNSVLHGGAGADTLTGGSGADSLYAGSGGNWLVAGSGAHQYLQGADPTTAAYAENFYGTASEQYQVIADEGTGGSDTLSAGSGGGAHWITGYGADSLYGGSGSDTLTGGANSYLQSGSVSGGVANYLVSGSTSAAGSHELAGGRRRQRYAVGRRRQ